MNCSYQPSADFEKILMTNVRKRLTELREKEGIVIESSSIPYTNPYRDFKLLFAAEVAINHLNN